MIKKVKKGFTLIELVVVIAVIAILSAVSVVAYVGITNNAKKSAAEQEARTLQTLLRTELTRENYKYESTDGNIVFSFNNEKIEYTKSADEVDLKAALNELIWVAQGNKKDVTDTDSYTVTNVAEQKAGNKELLVFISDSSMILKHYNGQQSPVFAFGLAA